MILSRGIPAGAYKHQATNRAFPLYFLLVNCTTYVLPFFIADRFLLREFIINRQSRKRFQRINCVPKDYDTFWENNLNFSNNR